MYHKILLPLDGSKLAEGVLPYAQFLAGTLQLPMDLTACQRSGDRSTVSSGSRCRLPESSGGCVANFFDRGLPRGKRKSGRSDCR